MIPSLKRGILKRRGIVFKAKVDIVSNCLTFSVDNKGVIEAFEKDFIHICSENVMVSKGN